MNYSIFASMQNSMQSKALNYKTDI